MFPSCRWEHGDKLALYGEKRLAMIHPYRTTIDIRIRVGGVRAWQAPSDTVGRRILARRIFGDGEPWENLAYDRQ